MTDQHRQDDSGQFARACSQAHRERLVEQLSAQGVLHAPHLAHALREIPREAFVPAFYQREDRPAMKWALRKAEEVEPLAWLELMYQDEPLVTKLDERQWPISSSSAPSVMVRMLEALDVQPGHRVLEIGTGTGYNAALLARLAKHPADVTTIELDGALAEQAARALSLVVGPVEVRAKDGRMGEEAHAPYDRIIVTASAGYIPRPWYEQLAPGGRLVMDLQGQQNASGFLVIEKSRDGSGARGTFRQPPLHFMPLLDPETGGPHRSDRSLFQQACATEVRLEPASPLPRGLRDPAFCWFLQWFYRSLTVSLPFPLPGKTTATLVLKDLAHETVLQLNEQADGGWQGKQRGAYPLWEQIERAYETFLSYQQPTQERYEVVLSEEQAQLVLTGKGSHDALLLCDLYW
jgi:protein-L-isoaspartate(D-aspartate) O-methyltransferase